MPALCSVAGLWDQVKAASGGKPYLSRQQHRAYHLLILCELIGGTPFMSNCTVNGLWDQVRGIPPFISEQEYMEEDINLLCQLLAGGGGGGGGAPQVFSGHGAPVGLQTAPDGRVQNGVLQSIYLDMDEGMLQYDWDIPSQTWGGI